MFPKSLRICQLVAKSATPPTFTSGDLYATDDYARRQLSGTASNLAPFSRTVHGRLCRIQVNASPDVRQSTAELVGLEA